ncbi:MAG: hypothetical protein JWR04_2165 [Rhodoglobus sp.]|nr:hypothetical protein [Rhodoglobus sp.]
MTDPAVGRLHSLDGLRGVAALAVVLHHSALAAPGLLEALWPGRDGSSLAQVATTVGWRALTFPLHLVLSAGLEAVFVFFILSGLVLTIPALRAREAYSWRVYYPRRIIRLGLPVLASIVLAVLLLLAVPRYPIPGGGGLDWVSTTNSLTLTLQDLLDTLNLLGPRQPLNNPLWSLGWEFAFSLLLPLGVLLATRVRSRRAAAVVIVASLLVITTGSVLHLDALVYLPMFAIGAVLAASLPDVARARGAIGSRRGEALWFVLCLVLVAAPWVASGITGALYPVTVGLAVAGCLGLVLLALTGGLFAGFLETRVVQFLGRISFSLYLVHVPVLVTTFYLFGVERWFLALPVGIALSLVVGWLFTLGVEQPSHRLARWVGRRIEIGSRTRRTATSGPDLRE